MLEILKKYRKNILLWGASLLLLAGCELGSTSKPRSPYRAPNASNSDVSIGTTSAEVGTSVSVTVTVRDKSGYGISDVVPTITAVDSSGSSSGITSGGCGSTNIAGVATCTIQSSRAASFTVKTVSPVGNTGNSVNFYQLPRSLTFTQQPSSSATSETLFAQQPKVKVLDRVGNFIMGGGTVTLSLTSAGGATLTPLGSLSVAAGAVDGIATFSGLKIDKAGTYTLTATITDPTSGTSTATSSAITVRAGSAAKLKFSVMPSSSSATGVPFATQPVVILADSYGNPVTSNNTCVVSLTLTGGTVGDTLMGTTLAKTMTSGVADFSSTALKVNRIGGTGPLTDYRLNAAGSGSCLGISSGISDQFTITLAGLPNSLVVTQAPGTAALNEVWSIQPVVQVLDINGSLVTNDNSTTVVIANTTSCAAAGSCTLSGSTAIQVVNGVARFTGLSMKSSNVADGQTSGNNGKVYTYSITGVSPGLTIASASSTQTITTNGFTPAKLAFKTQPQNVAVNQPMGSAIEVKVLDANGYFCANDNSTQVSLAYDTTDIAAVGTMKQNGAALPTANPGTTNPVTVVNGVVSFSAISFTNSGAKQVKATAAGLTQARSSVFAISDYSTADNLYFSQSPADTHTAQVAPCTGGAWTEQPIVYVRDKYGNLVTNDNSTVVTLDCVLPLTTPSCSLLGTTSMTVTNGVANFQNANLQLYNNLCKQTGIVIRAQATGLNSGFSNMFTQQGGP